MVKKFWEPQHECVIWAFTRENLSSGVANNTGADQPAQSDQRLCYSHFGKYHI